jgi:hypothetical protein
VNEVSGMVQCLICIPVVAQELEGSRISGRTNTGITLGHYKAHQRYMLKRQDNVH